MDSIPEELMPALQGALPGTVSTCSKDGEPNVSFITQVYYVDDNHVALSRQFFNKTARNMTENPMAEVIAAHPETGEDWSLDVEYLRSETEGDLFENMEMQLEAIATNEGMEGVYHLLSADICKIISIEKCTR